MQNIAFQKADILPFNTTKPFRSQISYFVSGPASERTPERFVFCLADLPKDGPHITGEEEQYQVGEEISLNCTSGKSYPASELQWYINDEQVTAISRHYHGRTVPFTVSLSMQNILHRPVFLNLRETAARQFLFVTNLLVNTFPFFKFIELT